MTNSFFAKLALCSAVLLCSACATSPENSVSALATGEPANAVAAAKPATLVAASEKTSVASGEKTASADKKKPAIEFDIEVGKVCKKIKQTGTRFKREVCASAAQWEKAKQSGKDYRAFKTCLLYTSPSPRD